MSSAPSKVRQTLHQIEGTFGGQVTDEVRKRMFRPNFTTKGAAGTGLGLLIVSSILMANHAAMWVDSASGAGTTVTLAWPSISTVDPSQQKRSDQSLPNNDDRSTGLLDGVYVLVVDDMSDVAEVLADMLEAAGAVAVAISDPVEAAQVLTEAPDAWAVLVTDLHMPEMDGVALARHAAALSPPVPAVLVTARSDILDEASVSDFAAILSKPVTSARLAQAVRSAKAPKK